MKRFILPLFLLVSGCNYGGSKDCVKPKGKEKMELFNRGEERLTLRKKVAIALGGAALLGTSYVLYGSSSYYGDSESDSISDGDMELFNSTVQAGLKAAVETGLKMGAVKALDFLASNIRSRRALEEHVDGVYSTSEVDLLKAVGSGVPEPTNTVTKEGISYTVYGDGGEAFLMKHKHGRESSIRQIFEDVIGEINLPKVVWYKEGLELLATANKSDIEGLLRSEFSWIPNENSARVISERINVSDDGISASEDLFNKGHNKGNKRILAAQWVHEATVYNDKVYVLYSTSHLGWSASLYLGAYSRDGMENVNESVDVSLFGDYLYYGGEFAGSADKIDVDASIIGTNLFTFASQSLLEKMSDIVYIETDLNAPKSLGKVWDTSTYLKEIKKFQHLKSVVGDGDSSFVFFVSNHDEKVGVDAAYARIFHSNGTFSNESILINNPGHDLFSTEEPGLQLISDIKAAKVKDEIFVAMVGRKSKVDSSSLSMSVKILDENLNGKTKELFMDDGEYFLSEAVPSDTESGVVDLHYAKRESDGIHRKVKTFYLGDKPVVIEPVDNGGDDGDSNTQDGGGSTSGNGGNGSGTNNGGNTNTATLPNGSGGDSDGGSNIGIIAGAAGGGVLLIAGGGFAVKKYVDKKISSGERPKGAIAENGQSGSSSAMMLNEMNSGNGNWNDGSGKSTGYEYYSEIKPSQEYGGEYFEYAPIHSSVKISGDGDPKSIDKKRIRIIKEVKDGVEGPKKLGEGKFGVVFKAEVKNNQGVWIECAAKRLKCEGMSEEQIIKERKELKREIDIMKKLDGCQYALPIIFYTDDLELTITEFIKGGSIKDHFDRGEVFDTREKLTVIKYLAEGMNFISNCGIVHRDLAARNVFEVIVDGKISAKIGDLGLARETDDEGNYEVQTSRPLPFAWMAPEALEKRKFSSDTDKWAFGVTMWEIMSNGGVPYAEIRGDGERSRASKVYEYVVTKHGRLNPPQETHEVVIKVMNRCWEYNPSNRMSFAEISSEMGMLVKEMGGDYTPTADAIVHQS